MMEIRSVTPEEYDARLRATVNAYYEHAMNAPGMTKEEAIESTAQMSEQYLEAVEEFQSNADTVETVGDTTEAGLSDSGTAPDGPDDDTGMDGPSE